MVNNGYWIIECTEPPYGDIYHITMANIVLIWLISNFDYVEMQWHLVT